MFQCNLAIRLMGTHNYYLMGDRKFTHKPSLNDVLIVEYGEGLELTGDCEAVILRSVEGDGIVTPIVVLGVIRECKETFDLLIQGKPDFQLVLGNTV